MFLTADIGVSGVNFGVAETGTLCLVTNEGNGRMVTSLPPVHVALMGIERLVPTLDDLALFLSLLPRSATGQKLSVYTSLIHSPKRVDDVDGPQERHLILVDNGRSAMRNSPLAESLYCIRCGACLNACPVFREIGGHAYIGRDGSIAPYPGPIGVGGFAGLFGCENLRPTGAGLQLCAGPARKPVRWISTCRNFYYGSAQVKMLENKEQAEGIGIPAMSQIWSGRLTAWLPGPIPVLVGQWLGGFVSRHGIPLTKNICAFRPGQAGAISKDFPRLEMSPFRCTLEEDQAGSFPDQSHPFMWLRGVEHVQEHPSSLKRGIPGFWNAPFPIARTQFIGELAAIGVKVYRLPEQDVKTPG